MLWGRMLKANTKQNKKIIESNETILDEYIWQGEMMLKCSVIYMSLNCIKI